jgi:hypothetical protein
MANVLKINRTAPGSYATPGNPSSLEHGELAFNNAGEKLFIGKQTSASSEPTASEGHTSVFHLSTLKDLSVTAGTGLAISTVASLDNNARALSGVDATVSTKGVASFNDTFFNVSSGAVSLDAAQTGITSILNANLVVGRDADNQIDFGTDNEIDLKANGEVVSTISGTELVMHGDNRLSFSPSGTTAATTINSNSYIQEFDTTNTVGHGDLRIYTAGLNMIKMFAHATLQDYISLNQSGNDIDFHVYDDDGIKQLEVVAESGASKVNIRDLVVSNTVDLSAVSTVNVSVLDASTAVETPEIRANGGTAMIDITSSTVTFNKDIQIGSASDVTPTVNFRNGTSVGGYVQKHMDTGDMTIYNGLTGTDTETRTDNLIIQNAIADADILFKINDSVTGVATAMTIDGATNTVTIAGDLVVQGDTTTLNTSNLIVEDAKIVIADNATTSSAADGAGIYIGDDTSPVESISYAHTGTKWVLSTNTSVSGTLAVDSTSTFTGAVTASGGFTNTTFDCGTF